MEINEILKNNGIEAEKIESIGAMIKNQIDENFVSKKQYAKRLNEIDTLKEKVTDLESKGNNDEYKSKYENLQTEYDNYKKNIETEKTNEVKTNKIKENLKAEGVNEKLINLLLKEFEIDKIEIEKDSIKNWEEYLKPIKESYNELFTKVENKGIEGATMPPVNNSGEPPSKKYIPPIII